MKIQDLAMGKYVDIGTIRFNGEKVTLDFLNKRDERFYERVGYGTKSFSPTDGLSYIEAIITLFGSSTGTLLIREPEDDAWWESIVKGKRSTI
jgi:hypothetical protein